MAYDTPIQFSFSLQDSEGVIAAETLYANADSTKLVSDLVTDYGTVLGLVEGITAGKVIHGRVSLQFGASTTGGRPVAGVPIEQTALFTEGNASNSRSFGVDVPSFLTSKISGGRPNLADTEVAAFVSALDTPATDYEFTNNQFIALNGLRRAELSFRKHRRALTRLSSEV